MPHDKTSLFPELTPKQIAAVVVRVNMMREALAQSMTVMAAAAEGKFSEVGKDNVYHIIPNIQIEFNQTATHRNLTVHELLSRFEKWTVQTTTAITGNLGHLQKNKALVAHIHGALDTCQVIDHATKMYLSR